MKAIYFDGRLSVRDDYPMPAPKEDEVLVRVLIAGICNTDMEILKGYLSFQGVIGHEFVGIVEEAPAGSAHLIGKRVVGEINCGCGICDSCKSGVREHCPDRTTLGMGGRDGAFAEYVALPAVNVHVVPENVLNEEAVFVEPLAAAFEIIEQISLNPSDRVIVLGDGKLGILCCAALGLAGARVTLAGRHKEKLQIAQTCCNKVANMVLSTVDYPAGSSYDIVVEATGSIEGFEQAMALVRPRGTIVLKSTVAGSKEMNLAPIVINEITVVGSRCGPFGVALEALSQYTIDVKPLITAVYPFEKAGEAFKAAAQKGSLKVLIDFGEGRKE